jgi:hypothetical protein
MYYIVFFQSDILDSNDECHALASGQI